MKAIIVDVDGTLADVTHRLHHLEGEQKDWDSFFAAQYDDKPFRDIVELVQQLYFSKKYRIIVVTARPNHHMQVTSDWLKLHHIYYHDMYMRDSGDFRPDDEVKAEILQKILDDGFEPFLAVDDRPSVVEMWRSFGITTLQCAPDEPVRTQYTGTLLTMLVGPAGAGKTTYCEKNYRPQDVISTDKVREENGWGHHPDDLARTWKYVHGMIKVRLQNGMRTVLDATNLKVKDRMKVLKLVPQGQLVEYLVIDRDYDEKIKNRGWRPIELIDKHHKAMKGTLPAVLQADGQGNVLVKDVRKSLSQTSK